MHPVVRALACWPLLLALCPCLRASAERPGGYDLPLAQATEWQVLVFGARAPAALQTKPIPFTAKLTWQAPAGAGSKELTGTVLWLKTVKLPVSLPAGCSAFSVTLDWQATGVDLDLGMECPTPLMRLAPVLTTLKPERLRLDAQTAPFYRWLASLYPDWWRGYPFWAELKPAPMPAAREPSS